MHETCLIIIHDPGMRPGPESNNCPAISGVNVNLVPGHYPIFMIIVPMQYYYFQAIIYPRKMPVISVQQSCLDLLASLGDI